MHKLARQVRFSINPFLSQECTGFNSFASKPAGEGLSIFLELSVEVLGDIEPDTGFVVNVVDIDRGVREFVVPLFVERIKQDFCRARHIGLFVVAELLRSAWGQLSEVHSYSTICTSRSKSTGSLPSRKAVPAS